MNSRPPSESPPVEPDQTPGHIAPDQDEAVADDPVDTWGMQSFPASDPPQWWAGAPDYPAQRR
jgi:hypothetical protein